MNPADTSLGGDARRFPSTVGDTGRFRNPDRPEYRQALEELCRRYWKPVYSYIRLSWAQSNDDAKDLTQAFFAWILEGEPLQSYRPERGGFRPFLKTLLSRFVGHQQEAAARLKRGGGTTLIRLDDAPNLDAARTTPPADAFDRQWLTELMKGAVDRVRARLRPDLFRVFEAHDLCDEPPTYAELAARFDLRESQVRDTLGTVRRDVRREIRRELERLTPDAAELEEEWQALFGYGAASSRTSSAESGRE